MKIFKKIIIVVFILLIILVVGLSIYVHMYGKILLEESFSNALNRKVVLEDISYQFPLGLKAHKIQIAQTKQGGEFFEAEYIYAQLSPQAIYQGQLIFRSVSLFKPFIVVDKKSGVENKTEEPSRRYGVVIPPNLSDKGKTDDQANEESKISKFKKEEVIVNRLVLRKGRIQYSNSSINKDFSFAMEDVYLKAKPLIFPLKPGRTDFNIAGRLIKKGNPLSGSSVEGRGWVDVIKRDMEAKVEIIEADGSVGMVAQAVSKDNSMEVKGDVKFQNIFAGAHKENSKDSTAVSDMVFNALSSAGVKIGAKFSFKTKMDDFRPEQVSFSGNVVTK